MAVFVDRRDAGSQLALELQSYAERPDVVIVAIAGGGIPVGYELSVRLGVQLVVFDATTLGTTAPHHTIIVAVDGVETADSLIPYASALRRWSPDELVAAIPVACADACASLARHFDNIVCLVNSPRGVERSYLDFSEGSDTEGRRLVKRATRQWRERSLHGSQGW
jgi:predicted phosphoribosyltransferase